MNDQRITRRSLVVGSFSLASAAAATAILSACGQPAAPTPAPAPTSPPPTAAPRPTAVPPTVAPTAAPAATSAPTSAPTVVATAAPATTQAPTAAATAAPAATSASTAAPTTAPTAASAATAAPAGKAGGQFTQAFGEWPVTFNPIFPRGGADREVHQLSGARLVNYEAGTRKLIGDLADTWDVSSDGLHYTFHLVKNAQWSDGQPATAKDVELTYRWASDKKTGSNLDQYMQTVKGVKEYLSGQAKTISGLTTPDDYTVSFELTQPDATFMSFIAGFYGPYLLPWHVLKDMPPEQFNASDYATNPMSMLSLGPFKVTAAEKDQYIEFSRNDAYFKGKPLLDKFVARVVTGDTAVAALEKGEVDMASIPGKDVASAKSNANVRIQTSINYNMVVIMFNMSRAYLKDPRIHQALLLSIDRKAYVDKILGGYAEVWDSIIVQPDWYSPNTIHYTYDPEKAKSLLKEANWDPNREVGYMAYSADPLTTVVQQSAAAIGMKIKPVTLEYAAWFKKMHDDGDFDLIPVGGPSMTDDPNELLDFLKCDVWGRYCNQQLLDLFAQGRKETDPAKRKQIYYQIQDIMNKELPWIPLWHPMNVTGLTKRAHPFAISAYDYNSYDKWWVDSP